MVDDGAPGEHCDRQLLYCEVGGRGKPKAEKHWYAKKPGSQKSVDGQAQSSRGAGDEA